MSHIMSNRVDALTHLSERAYDTLYGPELTDMRAQRILCLGINTVAQVLETSYGHRLAGDQYHQLLVQELAAGGLSIDDQAYAPYPNYRHSVSELPRRPFIQIAPELTRLSNEYGAVRRATIGRHGERETDAVHAVHLGAIALPYALEIYPELDQSKIALYTLLHDIVEAYTGDVPSLGASDETMKAKELAEELALKQLDTDYGARYPRLLEIVNDYESRNDDEACFVKTFDKLDPSFTHVTNRGIALTRDLGIRSKREFRRQTVITATRMRDYSYNFPEATIDRIELLERVAAEADWPE
jgi:5'-deoxynucleotidase YfbR-like HD superfamily hydrolase